MIPIADLHTHPLLPQYYFRKDLGQRQRTSFCYPYSPFGTHIDLPRLKESGVTLMVACVYALNRLPHKNCFETAKAQIEMFTRWMEEHQDACGHAKSLADAEQIQASGRIAIILALEGGHHVGNDLRNLEYFRQAGVLYITLVHFLNNAAAESSLFADWTPEAPLKPFGKEMIAEMNRLGIAVDVAHCSERAFWEVMEHVTHPPLYSHGGAHALCNHHRNLTDDQARAIAERGGVLGVMLYPGYLKRHGWRAGVGDVVRHLEHWLKTVGPDAIAVGSDMNGVRVIQDVRDYAGMPRLAEAIMNAFGEPLARRILFENAVNFMRKIFS